MVKFEMIQRSDEIIRYEYYPEDKRDKKPGIIELDIIAETIELIVPAEADWQCIATASELNMLRDAINEMSREQGGSELTEEELPIATEDEEWYQYADHAIRRIKDAYNEGKILEKGTAMWY